MGEHGYSHCMPYGWRLSCTASPLVWLTVPFVIRLSPLHPGYVMTRCAVEREMDRNRQKSNEQLSRILDDILGLWSVCALLHK